MYVNKEKIYTYIHMCSMYVSVCTPIYIYIEREREKDREMIHYITLRTYIHTYIHTYIYIYIYIHVYTYRLELTGLRAFRLQTSRAIPWSDLTFH